MFDASADRLKLRHSGRGHNAVLRSLHRFRQAWSAGAPPKSFFGDAPCVAPTSMSLSPLAAQGLLVSSLVRRTFGITRGQRPSG